LRKSYTGLNYYAKPIDCLAHVDCLCGHSGNHKTTHERTRQSHRLAGFSLVKMRSPGLGFGFSQARRSGPQQGQARLLRGTAGLVRSSPDSPRSGLQSGQLLGLVPADLRPETGPDQVRVRAQTLVWSQIESRPAKPPRPDQVWSGAPQSDKTPASLGATGWQGTMRLLTKGWL